MEKEKIEALIEKIYQSLMSSPEMGLGERGEAREEAERIVNDWMTENDIKTK